MYRQCTKLEKKQLTKSKYTNYHETLTAPKESYRKMGKKYYQETQKIEK